MSKDQSPVHATDVSNASRTNLMNLNTLEWDEDLLKYDILLSVSNRTASLTSLAIYSPRSAPLAKSISILTLPAP